MNRNIRMILAVIVYIIGLAASIYVVGTLTFRQLVITIIKCACSTTVAGLIWVIGYVASNHVFDSRDEQ